MHALEAFHRQRLAGVIVASLQTPASDRLLLRLAEQSLPLVLVGRQLAHPRIDTISANFRRGGTLATQHLIAAGHRRIAFIGAQPSPMPRASAASRAISMRSAKPASPFETT